MKKVYWQVIYKEWGRIDAEFNEVGSQQIFETEIDAWKYAMIDCADDGDIAWLLKSVAAGAVAVKPLKAPEPDCGEYKIPPFYAIKSRWNFGQTGKIFVSRKAAEDFVKVDWDDAYYGEYGRAVAKGYVEYIPVKIMEEEEEDENL
jgi:hypothetical protein